MGARVESYGAHQAALITHAARVLRGEVSDAPLQIFGEGTASVKWSGKLLRERDDHLLDQKIDGGHR